MKGFDVVMIIAIILFARLGVRLVINYTKMQKEQQDDNKTD